MTDFGKLREQMKELDVKGAMREMFGKCPKCGSPQMSGIWLVWCPKRKGCSWVAPRRGAQPLPE